MVLKLYNTLGRAEQEFVPLDHAGKQVGLYSCGPTVYDYAHIGNWRTFITADLLRRTLEYGGFTVKHVMNITDVDDKTISGAANANLPLAEFTKKYEAIFLADLASLNCEPPTLLPHATHYIPHMITLIEKLLAKGDAYRAEDGIYFKITSFPAYGQLSGRTSEKTDDDFALWKFEAPEDQSNAWDASFGRGRPGWHIECSAMSMAELGTTFDIHTGGSDLIFPHHENEIAQSEAATGQPFARYWVHGAFLLVEGQKMSKSLKNIYTLKDLAAHGITPLAYRYWLLTGHYRSQLNFTWEAVAGAQKRLERLRRRVRTLPDGGKIRKDLQEVFLESINSDLNFARALAVIPAELNLRGPESISPADEKATWMEFDKVFGLGLYQFPPILW